MKLSPEEIKVLLMGIDGVWYTNKEDQKTVDKVKYKLETELSRHGLRVTERTKGK